MTSDELVSRETSAELPAEYSGESWETMVAQAVEVFGADLEKGLALVGVPFMGIRATIRPGDYKNPATKLNHPYASLDLIVGPQKDIDRAVRRGRVKEDVNVEAGEHLVVNLAGTGAYRQIVQTLEAYGAVTLPLGPEGGQFGGSRFDSLASAWVVNFGDVIASTGKDGKPDGGEPTLAFDLRLYCPRGFRASEYENEYTKEGVTLYIG